MKSITWLMLLIVSAGLSGCARVRVSCEMDPTYSFSQVRAYQWVDAPAAFMKQDGAFLDLQIQQALNNELAARGWKQVLDAADASIQVACCLIVESHVEYTKTSPDHESEFSGGLVFDRSDREWNYEERTPDQIEYIIETGTIHCMINDAASGNRVWHGRIESEIDRSLAPEKQSELYQDIARKLFRELP